MWWETRLLRGLEGDEEERPTRLMPRKTQAEKVNVLPKAATGFPCPPGEGVSPNPALFSGNLAKILLHPLVLPPAEGGGVGVISQ